MLAKEIETLPVSGSYKGESRQDSVPNSTALVDLDTKAEKATGSYFYHYKLMVTTESTLYL
jgi:hypothetical protein